MYLVLILITIYYGILPLFFNIDKTKVYCGIFMYVGPKDITKNAFEKVINTFKILGVYNDTRGGDNVGIFINNEVHKNKSYTEVTFKKFAEKNYELFNFKDKEIVTSTIIGHSRKGSVGGKTLTDAHPFEIQTHNGDTLVGVHNGTISNWKELLLKYQITEKLTNDSHAIYTIIAKTGNYDVLKEYIGAGTFVWTYKSDPQKVFIYKGSSKVSNYITDPLKAEEERPLFFYFDKKNKCHFFSSMQDSLSLIFPEPEVKSLQCNKIWILENGLATKDSFIEMDRSNSYQKFYETATKTHKYQEDDDIYGNVYGFGVTRGNKHNNHKHSSNITVDAKNAINTPVSAVHLDKNQKPIVANHIYTENFRYMANGVVANGIYLVNSKTGKIYTTYRSTIIYKHIKEDIKKEEDAFLMFICKGLLCSTIENYSKLTAKLIALEQVFAPPQKVALQKEASKFLYVPGVFDATNIVYYNGDKFTGMYKPDTFKGGLMAKAFNDGFTIENGCVTKYTYSTALTNGNIIIKYAQSGEVTIYCTFSKLRNMQLFALEESIEVDNSNKTIFKEEGKPEINFSTFDEATGKYEVIDSTTETSEEDIDEAINQETINSNHDLFLITEAEILETINTLFLQVENAKEYATKSLKIGDWKKYLSFEIDNWIKDSIHNCIISKDAATEYIFDKKTGKYNFNLEKDFF